MVIWQNKTTNTIVDYRKHAEDVFFNDCQAEFCSESQIQQKCEQEIIGL